MTTSGSSEAIFSSSTCPQSCPTMSVFAKSKLPEMLVSVDPAIVSVPRKLRQAPVRNPTEHPRYRCR